MPFWKNLKQGYDHFEVTRQQPKVDVCEKRYVFDAQARNFSQRLDFNPAGKCPVFEVPDEIASAVREKNSKDESATLALIKRGTPAAPVRTGQDGGMHPVFLAAMKGPSLTDADGNFRPTLAPSTPGTIPAHARAPGDASPVYAPDTAVPGSEKPTGSVMTASVPVPRPAPHRERAPGSSNFAQRLGSFFTASAESKPAPAPAAAQAAVVVTSKPKSAAQPAGKPVQPSTVVARAEPKAQKPSARHPAVSAADQQPSPAPAPAATSTGGFENRWSAFR
jgi:hypothetical protein